MKDGSILGHKVFPLNNRVSSKTSYVNSKDFNLFTQCFHFINLGCHWLRTLLKTKNTKKKDFVNCKNAAQFPFMQPKNTSLVPNTTPFIDFGLNLLATGRIEPTIRISVVMQPLNFSFFNSDDRLF